LPGGGGTEAAAGRTILLGFLFFTKRVFVFYVSVIFVEPLNYCSYEPNNKFFTVPTCSICNRNYTRDEIYILDRLKVETNEAMVHDYMNITFIAYKINKHNDNDNYNNVRINVKTTILIH